MLSGIMVKLKPILSSSGSSLLLMLVSLVVNKLVASVLPPKDYALYGQFVLLATIITCLTVSGLINSILDKKLDNVLVFRFYSAVVVIITILLVTFACIPELTALLHIPSDLISIAVLFFIPMIYALFAGFQALYITTLKTRQYFILNVANAILGAAIVITGLYLDELYLLLSLVLLRPGVISVLYLFSNLKTSFLFSKGIFCVSNSNTKPIYGYYFYGVASILTFSIISAVLRNKLATAYGIEEIGFFFSAQRIFELIVGLAVSFYSTFYFNRLCTISTLDAKKLIYLASAISILVFLLIAVFINVLSESIIIILLSASQLPATEYFFPLSINLVINSVVYSTGFYVLSFYSKSRLVIFELCFFTLTVSLIYLLPDKTAVWSLAIVSLCKLVLNSLILYQKFSNSRGING